MMNVSVAQARLGSLLAGVVLLVNTGVVAQGQPKHRVTFDDLQTVKRVDYLQLSLNGEMLAYVTGGELWLAETRRGGLARKVGKGDLPVWSPDGKSLAYSSSESGTLQLCVLDLGSGRAEQVTNFKGGINPDPSAWHIVNMGDPMGFRWSLDSTRLVFASRVVTGRSSSGNAQNQGRTSTGINEADQPLVLTTQTPPEWTLSGVFRYGFGTRRWINGEMKDTSEPSETPSPPYVMVSQLFVVDIRNKEVEQLTNDDGMYFNPDWSPDGREIVCVSTEGRHLQSFSSFTRNVIYAIDIASGKKRALTTRTGQSWLPRWSPDGKWIAYWGGAEGYEIKSVFLIPATGGRPVNLTSGRHVVEFHWSADGKSIIVMYRDGVAMPMAGIDVSTGFTKWVRGKEPPVAIVQMSVSRTGTLAWSESDGSSQGVIRILPAGASSPYILVDLNPQIKEWELGEQLVLRWKNSRDDELEGVLIKPVGYRAGRRYPLIVDCYPGTGNWFRSYTMLGNQAWASNGYVVLFPAARAPHVWNNVYKTVAFMEPAKGPKGWDVTVDDVMSAVNELIRRGIVDPDRMGLYGFSNGGGIVDYLVTRTGRFKCAVSVAGVYPDWVRPLLLEFSTSVPWLAGGITPWDDPERYIQLSAVYHLNKVTTPMLLAVGDRDTGTFLLGMIEMYNGLRYLGKDVTLLRYPDQEHGFTGVALRDFWKRENAFFDKYLRSDQSPK